MIKKTALTILLILTLTSCVNVSSEKLDTATPAPRLFVTSTLPPTKQALTVPTRVPPTSTPEASTTTTVVSTSPVNCRDSALLVEDVTYPDNALVNTGEKFTKTWKLQNTGTCTWTGYTVAFVNGDRMASPDSVPVPETASKATVEVSVELTAPSTDKVSRGNFELHNAEGKTVSMGTESIFWVQVVVGTGGATNISGTPIVSQVGNCSYTVNDGYVQQLIELINQARADVGRAPLTVNQQLMNAAQGHSLDMACNNFLSHSGSDGSWIGDRLVAAGYPNSYYREVLAIGLPQDAMNQWRDDTEHWNAIIDSRVTEIGAGYVYSKYAAFGSYWTVDMGGP